MTSFQNRIERIEKTLGTTCETECPRQISQFQPWEHFLYGAFADIYVELRASLDLPGSCKSETLAKEFSLCLGRLKLPEHPEEITSSIKAREFLLAGVDQDKDLGPDVKDKILSVIREPFSNEE